MHKNLGFGFSSETCRQVWFYALRHSNKKGHDSIVPRGQSLETLVYISLE